MKHFRTWWILIIVATLFATEPIPLPKQSIYMEKGIQAGIGLGTVWRTSCQARFQWLGGVEYAYTPRISGSASARMFGGNLDANSSLVYSRYFINGRYHFQRR